MKHILLFKFYITSTSIELPLAMEKPLSGGNFPIIVFHEGN